MRPVSPGYFADHDVEGLGAELRAGRCSPGDLVERALDEAQRLNPVLNAYVTVDAEGARAAARTAAEELAAGTDRGPLHGIPVAVKDIVDTAGLRTTMGSRHFADNVPDRDAACVAALRAAGAIVIGKTTTHEFAYGGFGDVSANGAATNPHDPERMTGGSSAGSAAAVAAGMVPLAVGTDTGGSVRLPSALCGLVGLRPTYGAVSTEGVFPLAESLDTVGPMARTPNDCRLFWRVLAGTGPGIAGGGSPATGRAKIARLRTDGFGPVDDAVAAVVDEKLAGAAEVTLPNAADIGEAYLGMHAPEVTRLHAERVATAPELYQPEVLERIRLAARVTDADHRRALAARDSALSAVRSLFADHDVLALPTVPVVAPPLGARTIRVNGEEIDGRTVLLSMTSAWGVLGLPAISVPAGLVDALPVAIQLIAPPNSEELLLTAAEQLF
ncbi:amidase [Pseudonocardia acaciae]|uniref:amidase n=1 Tax=Pseudonocardia acaciae TaxID=551276 RepID=UPI0004911029|nr:amidase [Pseudonocardia acaciae]